MESSGNLARPTTVSLAVLPFDNLSPDAKDGGQDYFSRGFVEDLLTDLSRFAQLRVMAAHSAERIGASAPAPDAAGKPRVDYLLKGSVRRDPNTLRITAQLVTPLGDVEWAGRFDEKITDLFQVQDEITAQVVGSLSSRINASLLAAARRKPVTELAAYDAWLRGSDQLREGTLAADRRARELFKQALSQDPDYSRAHLGMSLSYFNEWSCGTAGTTTSGRPTSTPYAPTSWTTTTTTHA